MSRTVITDCSGGDCIAITRLNDRWFRLFNTINPHIGTAGTADEFRAFALQVKAGQFDELLGLEPSSEAAAPAGQQ